MSRTCEVKNRRTGQVILPRARWCASTWCHFRGLMLAGAQRANEGLVFAYDRPSRTGTTIHMLFMRYAIGVVWLDDKQKVIDKKLAKPWRLAYAPSGPAQYFLEANESILEHVEIGDTLQFNENA